MNTGWDEIKPGQNAELSVSHGGMTAQFGCTVRDHTDETLDLLLPPAEEAAKALVKDSKVCVVVHLKDGSLEFETTIADRIIIREPIVRLDRPGCIERRGPGGYYRLASTLSLQVRAMADQLTPDGDAKPGVAVELSAVGLTLETKLQLKPGGFAEVSLKLEGAPVSALCRTKDVRMVERFGKQIVSATLEFESIEENERDRIVKFIFDRQIKQKQKGMTR